MQSDELALKLIQVVLQQSDESAKLISLIDECLLLLSEKRRTLEEKAIAEYFHQLASCYAGVLVLLHSCMSTQDSLEQPVLDLVNILRTVNEKVRNCVEELLKILKYNLNFLEQYFEYDYCARLRNNPELLDALEALRAELAVQLNHPSS